MEAVALRLRSVCVERDLIMAKAKAKHIDPAVLNTAAMWQARLTSGSTNDLDIEQHMEWLLADPAHIEAEEFLAATMKETSEFEAAARVVFAQDFNVSKRWNSQKLSWTRLFGDWAWPQYGLASAAAAALLFFVLSLANTPDPDYLAAQTYASEIGHVKTVKLADGSLVSLFGESEVSVRFQATARIVHLKKGRAFFDVTKDRARPFYVNTAARQVKVLGTRFEVLLGEGFDQVSVNEGLVSVDILANEQTPEAASKPVLLEPGVVAYYNQGKTVPRLSQKETATIGAWSDGVLTYREEPLIEIVAAINGLFPGTSIELTDVKLASIAFSGTLVVSSSVQMAQQLADFLQLDVTVGTNNIKLASK